MSRNLHKNYEHFILKSHYVKLSSGERTLFHFIIQRIINRRERRLRYICAQGTRSFFSQRRRDLSIQFIGTFNRVRGIWFVDDVNDSWMPLLLSNESSNTRDDTSLFLRFFTTCTVIDTPLNFGRRLFQGFAHHWLLSPPYIHDRQRKTLCGERNDFLYGSIFSTKE